MKKKGVEAELNAIQKIARGVAHDYNNLLTVIDHSVYFLQHDTRLPVRMWRPSQTPPKSQND